MKKRSVFGTIVILLFFACNIFSACATSKLNTPVGFQIDDTYKLTWSSVSYARSYVVQIISADSGNKVEQSCKRAYYSLSSLEEGDYDICVKAIGNDEYLDSDWSQPFSFHKNYETGCVYTLINSGSEYEVSKVGTAEGSIEIEAYYRGKPVTSIAAGAFKGSATIERVVIGENVRSIGANAFYNCTKLLSVTIPDSVTEIGASAFKACRGLTELVLPSNLQEIEENTFAYCRGLQKITFGEKITAIGESAFSDCSALKELILPNTVVTLGEYAFSGNSSLEKVVFGDSLETVGAYAFYRCAALIDLTFGKTKSLREIGEYAFAYCDGLTELSLPDGTEQLDSGAFYNDLRLRSVTLPDTMKKIGGGVFTNTKLYEESLENDSCVYVGNWLVACDVAWKTSLTEIKTNTFRSGLVGIADEVFFDCEKIQTISFPKTLKYVGDYAFYKNTDLWKVVFAANSVERIGARAFANCTTLQTVSMKDGIKEIGNYAFYNCSSLANDDDLLPSTVESVGMYAFKNTKLWNNPTEDGVVYAGSWIVGYTNDDIDSFTVKEDTKGVSDYAFYECESLQRIYDLDAVKYIGKGAFYGCVSLTGANLNDNLREIKDYTFYNCNSLYNVSVPLALTEIGRSAFYKCEKLYSVELSDTQVCSIGAYAFYGCTNLRTVSLSVNLESMGDYAFYKCVSLTSVKLPQTLKSVGKRVYSKCEGLTTLVLSDGLEKIGEASFSGCTSLTSVEIPDTVTTIGKNAFYNCSAVQTLSLGVNLETIGDYAFYGLKELSRLTLPASLRAIGKYAFKGAASVQTLYLNSDLEIGAHAFYGCSSMTVYTDGETTAENWHSRWNSTYRPVVGNCVFADDGSYVIATTVNESFLTNVTEESVLSDPIREGYRFVGWETRDGEITTEYATKDLDSLPIGTVLYAVWQPVTE